MKTLLLIIVILALLVVAVGAVNHATEIEFDYVAGSTAAVSLLWIALGVAAALVVAVLLGWAAGKGGEAAARRKLERELEATYRRLRESEARVPRPPAADVVTAVAPVVGGAASEAATVVAPVGDETATVVVPAGDGPAAVPAPPPDETSGVTLAEGDEPSAPRDVSS